MLKADVDATQIGRALDQEFSALSKRVRLATEKTGREKLVAPLRDMTRGALNSRKLPTTWRAKVYPDASEETISPAFFVSSKAPKIIAAFQDGATIRANRSKYLAIPTAQSGRERRHFLKGALTPAKWEAENRVKLRFQATRYGGVLIADTQAGKRRRGRDAQAMRREKSIVVFVLIKQVRLAKRLDIARIAEEAGASYKIAYEKAANAA